MTKKQSNHCKIIYIEHIHVYIYACRNKYIYVTYIYIFIYILYITFIECIPNIT